MSETISDSIANLVGNGGWQGPLAFFMLLLGKRLLDAALPPGWTFRFSQRYLLRGEDNDEDGKE